MQTSNVERIIFTGSSLKDFHVTACQLLVASVGPPCVTFSGDFKSFRSFSTHMNVKSIHYLPIISQMKVIYYVYLFFYMLQQMAGPPWLCQRFFLPAVTKRLLTGSHLIWGVFSVLFRVCTLQYKVPWGNCCCDLVQI